MFFSFEGIRPAFDYGLYTRKTGLAEELRGINLGLSKAQGSDPPLELREMMRGNAQGTDADAEAAWDAELARRMEQITRGEVTGERAESVFARLREKHR